MKLSIVLVLVAVAAAIGYLVGTDSGRQRRDEMIASVRSRSGPAVDAAKNVAGDAVVDAADDAVEAVEQFTA